MRFECFASLIVFSMPLFAGCGLYLDVGHPSAAIDQVAHGTFITVRLFNCFGAIRKGGGVPYPRETTTVTGTAEGLVNCHRISVPLTVVKLHTPGLSAVNWAQPKEGVWVLCFRVADTGPYFIDGILQNVLGALVTVQENGVAPRTQLLQAPLQTTEIDQALRKLATECAR